MNNRNKKLNIVKKILFQYLIPVLLIDLFLHFLAYVFKWKIDYSAELGCYIGLLFFYIVFITIFYGILDTIKTFLKENFKGKILMIIIFLIAISMNVTRCRMESGR